MLDSLVDHVGVGGAGVALELLEHLGEGRGLGERGVLRHGCEGDRVGAGGGDGPGVPDGVDSVDETKGGGNRGDEELGPGGRDGENESELGAVGLEIGKDLVVAPEVPDVGEDGFGGGIDCGLGAAPVGLARYGELVVRGGKVESARNAAPAFDFRAFDSRSFRFELRGSDFAREGVAKGGSTTGDARDVPEGARQGGGGAARGGAARQGGVGRI